MSDVTAIPATGAAQIATNAIRRSQNELRKDASVIANPNTAIESNDAVNAMVDARQQVLYTKAAVKVIGTADEMIKSLIDTHA
jgi:adenylate kinase